MKRNAITILICACIVLTQTSFISDVLNYPKLLKEKSRINSMLLPELVSKEEMLGYDVEYDGIDNLSQKKIVYRLSKIRERGNKEKIIIMAFSAPDNEKPYNSIENYLERSMAKINYNRLDGLEIKQEPIRSSRNDCLYFVTRWNPGEEKYPRVEGVKRVVFLNGRIFEVMRWLFIERYTDEEKKKWIDRIENLTYLNDLLKPENQEPKKISNATSTHKSRRRA